MLVKVEEKSQRCHIKKNRESMFKKSFYFKFDKIYVKICTIRLNHIIYFLLNIFEA